MENFREIEFEGVMLRVYRNGEIWRWMKTSKDWKQICSLNATNGYLRVKLNYKSYEAHRIIAMVYLDLDITDSKGQVDHIDRCRDNNNVSNLQLVTASQNHFNKGAKGYSFNKSNKSWCVKIKLNGKHVYSKCFKNEEDAAADYIKQKEIYHKID
jgi:hypothetical protein